MRISDWSSDVCSSDLERRKELSKLVHNEGENTKIAIRNIRRDAMGQVKDLLKEKEISEDDERRGGDEIQKLTDQGIKDVDEVVKAKERSEEHTSELQSLMRISYAVFCLKKKINKQRITRIDKHTKNTQ